MGKTFEVTLGGKVRQLRFHQRDAIELKKRFGEMPNRLVFMRVMGIDFEKIEPGKPAFVNPMLFDPEAQYALLHKALVRGGWNVSEDKVIDAVDDAIQNGNGEVDAADFFVPAAKCALYSGGVTGKQIDFDKATGPAKEEETGEGAEGKAPSTSETPG